MKKYLMLAMTLVAITFASCGNSVESKAESYATQTIEVLKSGDVSKIMELSMEVSKYAESLSEEDKKVFIEAYQKSTEAHKAEIEEASANMLKGMMGGSMNGLMNGIKSMTESLGGMTEDFEGMTEDLEGMSDNLEDMAEGLEDMVEESED